MPVILFTGATGDGKTHAAVKRIKEEAANGRPVFTNIKGINEEGFLPIEGVEPIPINDNGEFDWQLCPAADTEIGQRGSLIIYDESQKLRDKKNLRYFAHVNREKLSERAVISELDEHRHKGYDIIFITQNPKLLHQHLLGFVKEHYHFSRPFNKGQSQVALWRSSQESPNSTAAIERAEDVYKVDLDPEIFKYYKSTEEVTDKKVRIPAYMYKLAAIAIVCFVIAGGILINGFSHFSGGHRIGQDALDKTLEAQKQLEQRTNKSPVANTQSTITPEMQTKIDQCVKQFGWNPEMCREGLDKEYLENKNKQLEAKTGNSMEQIALDYNPNKPFDSTLSGGYQATTMPVFSGCMKKNGRYVAYTQQGTILHDVSQSDCKKVIENGDRPFNYFAQQQQQTERVSTSEQMKIESKTSPL